MIWKERSFCIKQKIISIEGPNLVGKTTLINTIKKYVPAVVYNDYDLNKYIIPSDPYPYFFARIRLQKDFVNYDSDTIVILDRWHISQYVFDFFGQHGMLDYMMKTYGMVMPRKSYMLIESHNVMKERLEVRKRENSDFVLKMPIDEQIYRYNIAATVFKDVKIIQHKNNIDGLIKEIIGL